jgi:uncharacterized protein (TIGR02001 family)
MKKALSLLALSIVLSTNVCAKDESSDAQFLGGNFGGSAKLASDYVFRGESEVADGDIPSVQVTFSWAHEDNGIYAGVFSSTNKFTGTPEISAVVGPYIGKSGNLTDSGITYDIMVFHYMYPGTENLDYTELWIQAAKQFEHFRIGVEITPTLNDWFGVDGWSGVNYAIHPSTTFDNGVTLSASVGYQELSGEGAEGWTHWNVGVSKSVFGLMLDMRYHNTDVDSSHKVYGDPAGLEIFDDRLVFSVSKSF